MDGAFTVTVLTRRLDHPPAELWRALTDATLLALWLAPGRIEAKAGGRVCLDFADSGTVIDSAVTAVEAPRLVEFSWSRPGEPERPVRIEIAPDGAGARLTLTLRVPGAEDAGKACAGWEAHLEMLAAALAGAPIAFPFATFRAAREAYKER
ncbi:MAG TPA: SRPBCC domain-containing protein [Caulobacteraceae bacterium]|nr:SRPBCC domain-containing protein [Caulobacteraceae bacterium]